MTMKEFRENHKLRQQDMSNIIGIARQQYARYEAGKSVMPLKYCMKMSKHFSITLDFIADMIERQFA